MGIGRFFKKLFGIGATAAAAVATVKVAEKFRENNPDGVKDVNEDGKVDYKDVAIEVKKAAGDAFDDAKQYVQEKNPKLAENIKEGTDKVKEGFEKVKDKVQDVYADVSGEAPAEEAQVVNAAEDVVDAPAQEAKE
ncbi:MAG: hypothetical protein II914_01215 [Clostridia bacterium]|nr:hypothetical protein [Clostridia bacterium]